MASRSLITQQFEQLRGRADERDAGLIAGASESRILRQKPIPGMDGIYLFLAGQGNNTGDIEIGLDGPFARAYFVGFIRFEAMEAKAVFVGVDPDGTKIELVGRAKNANGNFAAVRRS
jgi:hypothetical protein